MRRRYLLPAVLLLAGGGVAAWLLLGDGIPDPPPWSPDLQTAADANNKFAFDLYAKLRTEPGNLFVSPISVHANLRSAADASAGTTRDELLATLHLPKTGAVGDLTTYYSAPRGGYELKMASAAWGEKTTAWKPDFLARTPHFRTADFVGNPSGEREAINRWMSEATGGQIPAALPGGAVGRDSRYVAANAVHFKAAWKVKFPPDNTRPGTFTRADGTKVTTPMMNFKEAFDMKATRYESDPEVIELPYRGDEVSMLVVMPKKHNGLPSLEAKLSAATVDGWLKKLGKEKVQVSLPKFRHEWRPAGGDLTPTLKALGVRAAFDPSAADFSPMTANRLFLTSVHHAAVIDVNEEGTKASARSMWDMSKSDMGTFVADHPFLYLIRDNARGTILFIGRYETP